MPALPPLLSLPPDQLAQALGGPGRASAVYRLLRKGRDPFAPAALGTRATERLRAVSLPTAALLQAFTQSLDGTLKARLGLGDPDSDLATDAVESVLIPTSRRTTLCISSQVGCGRGCVFCLTGAMGLKRHLTTDQILAQVSWGLAEVAERDLPPLRNLVFMGMGEPLDNSRSVFAAVELLTSPSGWCFSPRHVTVSTVGPSVEAILNAQGLPAQLAWSVHAARDPVRRQLVPTARCAVEALRDAFGEILSVRGDSLFVELTLIDALNDAPEDAEALIRLLQPLPGTTRVNLLPMNPTGNALRGSSPERVASFAGLLRGAGLFCSVRSSRGAGEGAACGQLAVGALRRGVRAIP